MSTPNSPGRTSAGAVVFDLGNVLIRWDPHPAVARGVGDDEATRFLAAEDFDFLAWNHELDTGRRWADATATVEGSHPHWSRHIAAYGEHFPLSIAEPIEANVAVVGTAVFVPLEVYELVERVTWLRVVAFAFNVFAVIYILWTKRLFGFRGGRAAFEAERHSQSLLEIEQAVTPAG